MICLKCKHLIKINTDGTVECAILGITKPAILCKYYKPKEEEK